MLTSVRLPPFSKDTIKYALSKDYVPITLKMDIEDLSMKLMIPLMCYFLLHGEMYVILGK